MLRPNILLISALLFLAGCTEEVAILELDHFQRPSRSANYLYIGLLSDKLTAAGVEPRYLEVTALRGNRFQARLSGLFVSEEQRQIFRHTFETWQIIDHRADFAVRIDADSAAETDPPTEAEPLPVTYNLSFDPSPLLIPSPDRVPPWLKPLLGPRFPVEVSCAFLASAAKPTEYKLARNFIRTDEHIKATVTEGALEDKEPRPVKLSFVNPGLDALVIQERIKLVQIRSTKQLSHFELAFELPVTKMLEIKDNLVQEDGYGLIKACRTHAATLGPPFDRYFTHSLNRVTKVSLQSDGQ